MKGIIDFHMNIFLHLLVLLGLFCCQAGRFSFYFDFSSQSRIKPNTAII